MSSRQVSQGPSARPTLTTILLAFLLILSLLFLFSNSIHAEAAAQEIKFTGKALASCAKATVTAVAVEVEDVILGPQPCMRMLVINIGSHLPGYVDRSIQEGDRVEVYGEYTSYAWRECSVSLSESHHYIKKIPGSKTNEPPVAKFTWQPISPGISQTVHFTDESYDPDGTIVDHSWTYGDGSFGAEPSHLYSQPGDYLVCLSVKDDDGDRNIACNQIKIRNRPTPPVDDDCVQSILVRGTVTAPPVTDSSSGYGYFFIRIAEVRHDTTGAVTVGELIQVRLSGSAFEALSEIAQGDYVEVCANWDTYLYCGECGWVRKVSPCLETDLAISVDDISILEAHPRQITATVHNIGQNDARAVKVLFQHTVCSCDIIACGPGRSAETIIDFIPKGGTAVARPIYTRPISQSEIPGSEKTVGNVREWVTVVVDPHNIIPETNEENNEARKTISVCEDERIDAEFVTNGWPEECQVSSGTYKPGDKVQADCRVKNTGSAQARFVIVFRIRAPNGQIYSITSNPETILPGGRHTYLANQDNLLLTIPADAPGGSYDVRLEVQGYNTGKIYDVWPTSGWRNDQFKVEGELVPCADTVVKGEIISEPIFSPRHFDLRIDEVIKNRNNIPTIAPGQNIIVTFSSALDPTVGSLHTGNCVKVSGVWEEDTSQYLPGLRCDPDSCSDHDIEKISCPSVAEIKFLGTITEPDNKMLDDLFDCKVKIDEILENASELEINEGDEVLVHKWIWCGLWQGGLTDQPGGKIIPEDWSPAEGDKVEVYGKLSEGHVSIAGHSDASYLLDLCGSDQYYLKYLIPWPIEPCEKAHPIDLSYGDYGGRFHDGVDIHCREGEDTPVVAVESGYVVAADPGPKWEELLIVEGEAYTYAYIHLDAAVKKGSYVHQGDVIGKVLECTDFPDAKALGKHLHFSIRSREDPEQGVVNPLLVLTPSPDFGEKPVIPKDPKDPEGKKPLILFRENEQPDWWDHNNLRKYMSRDEFLDPTDLHGEVDIVVRAYDEIGKSGPMNRTGVYGIRYTIEDSSGNTLDEKTLIEWDKPLPKGGCSQNEKVGWVYEQPWHCSTTPSEESHEWTKLRGEHQMWYIVTNTDEGDGKLDSITRNACWDTTSGGYPDGEYTVKITAWDAAGNDTVCPKTVIVNNNWLGNLIEQLLKVSTFSPVDISIVDPEGLIISKSTNAILEATYTEADLNGDGDPDDQIIIPNRKAGDYQIRVIPEERAFPIDRYTLEVSDGFDTIVLADYVRVGDIPEELYIVTSAAEGISVESDVEGPISTPVPTPNPKQGINLSMLIVIVAGAVAIVAIGVGIFLFLRSRYYI